jgi:hypothetical protein
MNQPKLSPLYTRLNSRGILQVQTHQTALKESLPMSVNLLEDLTSALACKECL